MGSGDFRNGQLRRHASARTPPRGRLRGGAGDFARAQGGQASTVVILGPDNERFEGHWSEVFTDDLLFIRPELLEPSRSGAAKSAAVGPQAAAYQESESADFFPWLIVQSWHVGPGCTFQIEAGTMLYPSHLSSSAGVELWGEIGGASFLNFHEVFAPENIVAIQITPQEPVLGPLSYNAETEHDAMETSTLVHKDFKWASGTMCGSGGPL